MPTCLLYFLIDNSAYQSASTANAVQTRLNWLLQKLGAQRKVTISVSVNAVDIGCKSLKALTDVTKIGSVVLQPASVGVFALQSALNKIAGDIARESATSAGAFRYLYVIAHRAPMPKLQASLLKQKMTSCGFADSRLFLLEGLASDDFLSLARNCVQASNDTLLNEVLEDMGLAEPETRPGPKSTSSREDKIKQLMGLIGKDVAKNHQPSARNDDSSVSREHGIKIKQSIRPTSEKTQDANCATDVSVAQNKALQQKVNELESSLESERTRNQQLAEKYQKQEGRVKELEAMLQDAKSLKLKAQDSSKLNGRLAELEASLQAATAQGEQLAKASQEKDARLKELEAKLTVAAGEKEQLTKSSEEQAAKVKELETSLQESAKQKEQLTKSSGEQAAKVKELEAMLTEAAGEKEQLTKSSAEQEAKVKELETKLADESSQNEQLTKSAQEQDAKVKELEAKLAEAASQTELQCKSAQEQETKAKELEAKLQATSAIVLEMRQKEQDGALKALETEKKLMLLEAEKNSMKAQLDMGSQLQMQTQKELATLNLQLQTANADKEALESKLEEAKVNAANELKEANDKAAKALQEAKDKAVKETSAIQLKLKELQTKYDALYEDTKEYMKRVNEERKRQQERLEREKAEAEKLKQKQQDKINSLFGGDDGDLSSFA